MEWTKKRSCKYCGRKNDLITPISVLEHCCFNCMDKFRAELKSRSLHRECDLCHKNKPICPTNLGRYLGEKNPDLCDECKDIMEPISEHTCKLIIWEITKDK